jgi:hypothetical protein
VERSEEKKSFFVGLEVIFSDVVFSLMLISIARIVKLQKCRFKPIFVTLYI